LVSGKNLRDNNIIGEQFHSGREIFYVERNIGCISQIDIIGNKRIETDNFTGINDTIIIAFFIRESIAFQI